MNIFKAIKDAYLAAGLVDGDMADNYAAAFHRDWQNTGETGGQYNLGHPDALDVTALVWIVEAGRALCGMNPHIAAALCRMAARRIEETWQLDTIQPAA